MTRRSVFATLFAPLVAKCRPKPRLSQKQILDEINRITLQQVAPAVDRFFDDYLHHGCARGTGFLSGDSVFCGTDGIYSGGEKISRPILSQPYRLPFRYADPK